MNSKNWLMNMISDGSEVSIKRVLTLAAFTLLAIAFLLNLFWDIKVSESLLNIMQNITVMGFGSTVVEKFAPKQKTPPVVVNDNSMTQNSNSSEESKN